MTLAAAPAGALVDDGHAGAIYNGTGAAIVTGSERAAIVSEIVRKPISDAVITEEQLRGRIAQAGMPEHVVAEIKRTFVQGYFDVVTSDIERLPGRRPKSLRNVLANYPGLIGAADKHR
ncbi:MAG TPA: hypothetical protein VEK79_15825 [Thermoanaerobaculia bacterium]|nr:hypothetical protein [Thermoanaerobaculia bacterium]